MIKAIFPSGLRVLGITDFNITELKKGRPIRIKLEDLRLPVGDLVIMFGKSELDIQKELSGYINIKTTIIDESSAADALIKRMASDEGFLKDARNKFHEQIQEQITKKLAEITQLLVAYKESSQPNKN